MPEDNSTALAQLKEYREKGREQCPFWMHPYTDLAEWKGKEEADRLVDYYSKGYMLNVPCIKDGVLLKSHAKYLKEKDETKDR